MSTTILNGIFSIKNVPYGKRPVVNSERTESLANYVKRVRADKGFSLADVRRNSGLEIANSYISRIENGEVTNVTPQKLRALARGLGVSEDEIFAVARGKPLGPMSPTDFYTALEALGVEQFQAYGGVNNLSDEDRAEIVGVLTAMIEQKLKRKQTAPKPRGPGKK